MSRLDYWLGVAVAATFLSVVVLEVVRLRRDWVFRPARIPLVLVSLGWAAWYLALTLFAVPFSNGMLMLGWTLQFSTAGAFIVTGHLWETLARRK